MNLVVLVGNITKDLETKQTQNGTSVLSFTIATQRKFKSENGEYQSDFINCVAWKGTAEFIAKYFRKGDKIGITGNMQTRTYDDKDGRKVYVTEVVIDQAEFVQNKKKEDSFEL